MSNASDLEIASTVIMGLAFLGMIAAIAFVWWKYHIYRLPDETGHRQNGDSIWLYVRDAILYGIITILTGLLTALSVLAMFTPPPIRREGQEQNNIVSWVYIVVAVLIAVGVFAHLLISFRAFRKGKRVGGKK